MKIYTYVIAVFRHKDLFRSGWITDSRYMPGVIARCKVSETR